MYNMSSAMATQFVQASNEMLEQIEKLGPNPLKEESTHHKGA
jgi:coenzyme F420-reducing hydrogenase delta subunit